MPDPTYQNPTFGTVTTKTNIEDNSAEKVLVQNSLGKLNWIYKNSLMPENYTNIVYVNANNPNSATIFDLNNPPVTNDNLLKSDVNNLYIGTDASTWVYKTSTSAYETKPITSSTSNFYLSGTTTDAGNSKTASIKRTGRVGGGNAVDNDDFVTKAQLDFKENSSNKTGTVIGNEASTSLYLHIAGMIAYFQQKLTDAVFGAFINSLTPKITPIDADSISIVDTADSNKAKKVSLTNFKAFLKTYFDTLYVLVSNFLEEKINGTAIENLTMTGSVNIDFNSHAHGKFILTGNTTWTFINTPAVGKSITRTYEVNSAVSQSLAITNTIQPFSSFLNDGSINFITVVASNTTTSGLKINVFFNS